MGGGPVSLLRIEQKRRERLHKRLLHKKKLGRKKESIKENRYSVSFSHYI